MPSEPATGQQLYHADALAPVAAVKVVGATILAIYALQIGLFSLGLIELVAAAIGFVAVALGLVLWARANLIRPATFGLRWPPAVHVIAGVLVGISAWYVNLWIVTKIQPPGDASGLQKVVEQTPLLPTILVLAVLPAVVEETVFRGILTRALATRYVPAYAVGLSAAVFGIYHLLPAQILTTFCLALVLGYLTLRASSAVPAMIAHLLNNVIAIVVSRQEVPSMSAWMGEHQVAMLVGTLALLGSGMALAATRGAA